MNTFSSFFLCSGILFLQNGAASYKMESLSLCLILSFKYCFNMIAKINTNKKYLDYFKNILLSFFFMFKEITGLCSLRKEFCFINWSYIVILSFLLTFSLLIYYKYIHFPTKIKFI